MSRYENQTARTIAGLDGNAPLVELPTITANPNVRLFGKLEGNNPASSVKDRAARSMVQRAEELESGFVVTIICDRGDRYLSSAVFADSGEQEII